MRWSCNGYRRRKWLWWPEFKSCTRLFVFHITLIHLGKVCIRVFSLQLCVNSRADWHFNHGIVTGFVCIAWLCLGIFWVFLLSSLSIDLFLPVVLSDLPAVFFLGSFFPDRFLYVFTFLVFVVSCLFSFNFHAVFLFLFGLLGEYQFYHQILLLLLRLTGLVRWWYTKGIYCTFPFLDLFSVLIPYGRQSNFLLCLLVFILMLCWWVEWVLGFSLICASVHLGGVLFG